MNTKELIAELEAALHQGESHDWRLLAPVVLDALKAMQAELTAAQNRLAMTPRPIEEAPKDGTWIVGLWLDVPRLTPELLRWAGAHGWERTKDDGHYVPTHFLPLPVKS